MYPDAQTNAVSMLSVLSWSSTFNPEIEIVFRWSVPPSRMTVGFVFLSTISIPMFGADVMMIRFRSGSSRASIMAVEPASRYMLMSVSTSAAAFAAISCFRSQLRFSRSPYIPTLTS